jgi:hypothetical protein
MYNFNYAPTTLGVQVEDKLYVGVREQQRLNTTMAVTDTANLQRRAEDGCKFIICVQCLDACDSPSLLRLWKYTGKGGQHQCQSTDWSLSLKRTPTDIMIIFRSVRKIAKSDY